MDVWYGSRWLLWWMCERLNLTHLIDRAPSEFSKVGWVAKTPARGCGGARTSIGGLHASCRRLYATQWLRVGGVSIRRECTIGPELVIRSDYILQSGSPPSSNAAGIHLPFLIIRVASASLSSFSGYLPVGAAGSAISIFSEAHQTCCLPGGVACCAISSSSE